MRGRKLTVKLRLDEREPDRHRSLRGGDHDEERARLHPIHEQPDVPREDDDRPLLRAGIASGAALPRAGDLGDPAVLDLRLLGRVGERFGDAAGGHELRSHLGQVGDAILDRPPDQRIDELVELGRANDPDRERAFEQRLLLRHLRRVVATLELVDADDRDDDDPLRPGCGAGSLQVPRRGGEERGRLLLVGRRRRNGRTV